MRILLSPGTEDFYRGKTVTDIIWAETTAFVYRSLLGDPESSNFAQAYT